MKSWLFIIGVWVFFVLSAQAGQSEMRTGINNPIGRGTTPPSSVRSGLVRSPNPIDTSGNLLITGNVRGSRYFRGIVPYRATTDFRAGLGSSSLDSFLRRSAGSEDFGTFSSKTRPCYSPTRTVTTTRAGYPGVFKPPTMIKGSGADRFAQPSLPRLNTTALGLSVAGKGRPMSMNPLELEKLLSTEIDVHQQDSKQIPAEDAEKQYKKQMELFRRNLQQAKDKAAELKRSLVEKDDSLQVPAEPEKQTLKKPEEQRSEDSLPDIYKQIEIEEQGEDVSQQFETQSPKEQRSEDSRLDVEDSRLDVYAQMKRQIDNLQKSFKRLPVAARRPDANSRWEEQAKEDTGYEERADEGRYQKSYREKSPALEELSDVDLSAKAKDILGEHNTFASFSKDKFNQHLRTAEDYLKQGRYYRAADAYTLASLYKPDDPLAYAGKSHALFAAGEYMSSALFLARALNIFPEYALFKIDIEAMVGDKDRLESRIADIEQGLKRNDAGELRFLLGYIYYQMGRVERAKKEINTAYEKMPQSPAVAALKEAIND